MEQFKMVFPTLAYKEKAIEYIKEHMDANSEINGAGGLARYLEEATYEEWLQKLIAQMDVANLVKPRVPGLTYFYIRESDDTIVGMVNIRLALNDFLRYEGGHIGYGVRPSERRKGYATGMLKEALEVCDTFGIEKVIVTCDEVNVASSGVVKKCGGVLEEVFYSEIYEQRVERYLIDRSEYLEKWF